MKACLSDLAVFEKKLADLTPADFATPPDWWKEEYGFFGRRYMEGDDSLEGYRSNAQSLEERTETEASGVIRLLDLKPGHRVLDCPCGYGRHSIALAKHGFEVVGVDINGEELEIARQKSTELANLHLVQEDMRSLAYRNEFDAVINMFYSFGIFDSDEENELVLQHFYKSLKPGGKFLMHTDVNVARITCGEYKFRETRHPRNGKRLEQVEIYDPARKRILGMWVLVGDNDVVDAGPPYSVRVYTLEEFSALCRSVGFKSITTYGYWDLSPLTGHSEDMMVIAEK